MFMAGNGSQKRNVKKGRAQEDSGILSEDILLVAVFALSVFLFLSNLSLCGPVGALLRALQLGLFGTLGYIFPAALLFITLILVSNRRNPYVVYRMTAVIFMLIFLAGLLELIFGENFEDSALPEMYLSAAAGHPGGGLIGGALAMVLWTVIGKAGGIVVLLASVFVCLVFITEKPLARILAENSATAAAATGRKAKENLSHMSAAAKSMREERLRKRDERKAAETLERAGSGVDFAATNLLGRNPQTETASTADAFDIHFSTAPGTIPENTRVSDGYAQEPAPAIFGKSVNSKKDAVSFENAAFDALADFSDAARKSESEPSCSVSSDHSRSSQDQDILNLNEEKKPSGRISADSSQRRVVTAEGEVLPSDFDRVRERVERRRKEAKEGGEALTSSSVSSAEANDSTSQIKTASPKRKKETYDFPPLSLLKRGGVQDSDSREEIRQNALLLKQTLESFGIGVTLGDVSVGPAVTRYELQPEQGVKVSRIVSLSNDLKLRLAAPDIRIEAPVPGKSVVGIEIPNRKSQTVFLGDILSSREFRESRARLAFGVGKDISGRTVVTDLSKMPHLLIAGATGSGKSVCINTLIMGILYKYTPEQVKLIMVDPKVVELQVYNGIPHLLIPVVTKPQDASAALKWAVGEMENRYKMFAEIGVRDIKGYNEHVMAVQKDETVPEDEKPEKLPQIVIIIDELADLMMVAAKEVEDSICRIAQLARACGMHLVIATQRPSVNVITGLIKANVPSRIAFAVSSGVDSRTIIDMNGAEKLLGKGDMLFYPQGIPKPVRVQGAFVSDEEVAEVVSFIRKTSGVSDSEEERKAVEQKAAEIIGQNEARESPENSRDPLFMEAGEVIIDSKKASIGFLQRRFRIGFNRAARIMDQLAEAGVVSEEDGTKPRQILMDKEALSALSGEKS